MSTVTLRPSVAAFAQLMEETLRKHDAKKGGQGNWRESDVVALFDHLQSEVKELHGELFPTRDGGRVFTQRVIAEAVDVANMAMMVADREADVLAPDPHGWPEGADSLTLTRRCYAGVRVVEGPGGVPQVEVEADVGGLAADSAARAIATMIHATISHGKQVCYHGMDSAAAAWLWQRVGEHIAHLDAEGTIRDNDVLRTILPEPKRG